jgi:hypothetical protein
MVAVPAAGHPRLCGIVLRGRSVGIRDGESCGLAPMFRDRPLEE